MQGVAGRLDTGGISDAWDRMRRYAGKTGLFPPPTFSTQLLLPLCDRCPTGPGPFPGRKQSRALGL